MTTQAPLFLRFRGSVLPLVLLTVGLPGLAGGQAVPADSVTRLLRHRIEAGAAHGERWAAGRRLMAERALPGFYGARGFRPAWTGEGRQRERVTSLLRALEESRRDGLDPSDYHADRIAELGALGAGATAADLVDLELLATDAFLVLGSHLLHGRVEPRLVEAEWLANRRGADMAAVLEDALAEGSVEAALDALRQPQPRYRRMREELVRLREIRAAGGWNVVEPGPTLRTGDSGPRVAGLRRRLRASGDLGPAGGGASDAFDAVTEAAVRRFQERHGLDADGAVGLATLAALNVPVERRIETLAINLERWRWMPADLGARHILVNVPDFTVVVRVEGEAVLRLRAVVGRAYRQTPVFTGLMTYLVLSPFWHVPPGIAAADKVPAIRTDPGYVRAQRMTLLDLATNRPVEASSVDWSGMTGGEFNRRYRLRQEPGPLNALGDVKFMFPNRYNVYLHDTPSRELFAVTERSFSSGCIRVERPLELATHLLRADPSWTPDRIRRVVDARRETRVDLPAALPVHLQYWTAFIDDEGRLNYRRDIYDRDARVLRALRADPPGP